jgi:Tol biopolymer transport system component
MEYVEGTTLAERIGSGGLRFDEALHYAAQIADALAAAHAVGIVHRDVKPANILIGGDAAGAGIAKVLDFGLAQRRRGEPGETTTTLTVPGTVAGTAAYMSPEQAEGKPVDPRSDVFSFGSTLYEMLTGRRPFERDSIVATMAAIVRDEAPPLDGVLPVGAARIVHRCLRKAPGQRWQHMADVRIALQEFIGDHQPDTPPAAGKRRVSVWVAAAACVVVGAAAVAGALAFRGESGPPVDLKPLTSFTGSELDSRISPDGKQVVYTWDGEREDNFDIYVQLIGPGSPLRLTMDPADDFSPAWSPDGRSIAFVRDTESLGKRRWQVYIVPAMGGVERPVAEVAVLSWRNKGFTGPYLTWTPDGKSLVVTGRGAPGEPPGLFLLSIDSGQRRRITAPPFQIFGDVGPSFSPDGRSLAFRRVIAWGISDIHVMRMDAGLSGGGETRSLTDKAFASSPTWTPDGREVVYAEGPFGNPRLWRVASDGSGRPRQIAAAGEGAEFPSISAGGQGTPSRLAFYRWSWDINIWRASLDGSAPPARLIASTRREEAPEYSPDGKQIAFGSDRSGRHEIWTSQSDGSRPVQLTSIGQAHHPSWSADGSRIVFTCSVEGDEDIYSVRSTGGAPQKLTSHPARDSQPVWSSDGAWIYFASNRTGRFQIWKVASGGGEPVQQTRNGGGSPRLSKSGDVLYFIRSGALWRQPVGGGSEEIAIKGIGGDEYDVGERTIYYFTPPAADGTARILAFDQATKVTRAVTTVRNQFFSLAVSPDERHVVYVQGDRDTADLMMLENFR